MNFTLKQPLSPEDRLIWTFVGFSLLAHLLFFVLDKVDWMYDTDPILEEWSIDAELIPDINPSFPKDTALPNAEKAKEARVPKQMLPQLPKKFAIKEAGGEPDEVAAIPKAKGKADDRTKKIDIKKDENEKNQVAMKDALRRLALEKLRKEQKLSTKLQAEQTDALARLKKEIALRKANVNVGTPGETTSSGKLYLGKLRLHIGRHYSVPEAYNLKNANLTVIIAVNINERGHLLSSEIKNSSGDSTFDEMAFKAVKDSVPLPIPPKNLVGQEVLLNFSPKSF